MRGVLKEKTVVLVTHQVDFLHNADCILVSYRIYFSESFEIVVEWY